MLKKIVIQMNSENAIGMFRELLNFLYPYDFFSGKERRIGSVEYQCNQCLQFCHQECISCYIPNRE